MIRRLALAGILLLLAAGCDGLETGAGDETGQKKSSAAAPSPTPTPLKASAKRLIIQKAAFLSDGKVRVTIKNLTGESVPADVIFLNYAPMASGSVNNLVSSTGPHRMTDFGITADLADTATVSVTPPAVFGDPCMGGGVLSLAWNSDMNDFVQWNARYTKGEEDASAKGLWNKGDTWEVSFCGAKLLEVEKEGESKASNWSFSTNLDR